MHDDHGSDSEAPGRRIRNGIKFGRGKSTRCALRALHPSSGDAATVVVEEEHTASGSGNPQLLVILWWV